MNRYLLLLLGLIALQSCRQIVSPLTVTDGRYTLVDSAGKQNVFSVYDDTTRTAWYPAYYIGKVQSVYHLSDLALSPRTTVKLDTNIRPGRISNTRLSIFVDTALSVARKNIYQHDIYDRDSPPTQPPKKIIDSIKYLKAYPVFFTNTCDSILWMGTFNCVMFTVREAKNEQGQWVRVEDIDREDSCGVLMRYLFLNPHEVLIAKLMLHSGNFKTQCRLRLRAGSNYIYSNTFVDNIDKSMFRPFEHAY